SHWCSSSTPGPGLPEENQEALSLIPSGAVRSTTFGAGGSFARQEIAAMRRMQRRRRFMGIQSVLVREERQMVTQPTFATACAGSLVMITNAGQHLESPGF